MFIVLGSPVTEVGRDHDYDWAIVEPSSMRSLIQLAGRIRRHRAGGCSTPNLRVFNTNLRHCRKPDEPAFCRPGFESSAFPLTEHHLDRLLSTSERDVIDARPRIVSVPAEQLRPHNRLVDLEHKRMRDTMLPGIIPPRRRGPARSTRETATARERCTLVEPSASRCTADCGSAQAATFSPRQYTPGGPAVAGT